MFNIYDGYWSWECVNACQNSNRDSMHHKKIIPRISLREVTIGQTNEHEIFTTRNLCILPDLSFRTLHKKSLLTLKFYIPIHPYAGGYGQVGMR